MVTWRGHCESLPGSFDECRLSTRWLPTLRPNQPTWPVSRPTYTVTDADISYGRPMQ